MQVDRAFVCPKPSRQSPQLLNDIRLGLRCLEGTNAFADEGNIDTLDDNPVTAISGSVHAVHPDPA